ncbi:MAG: hypothetical protein H6741_35015 [Alphaproteobacteria bacterium]|nr:hypothetical protein [Alphaproteobacteria bacterium]MCB9797921.1 hypothetical protein [Alphaproteobacteria bacterium]
MLVTLLASTALAGPPKPLPPTDLDGDGKPEIVKVTEEAVIVNGVSTECYSDSFACDVQILDVRSGDTFKELSVCATGPRDDVWCTLYAWRGGALHVIQVPDAKGETLYVGAFSASGSGILLADVLGRLYTQRHKLTLSKDGLSLSYVAQPFYYVSRPVHVDRGFPITMEPGAGAVVANVRADSDITVVVESATKEGAVLVHISSGLMGWTTWEALTQASDDLMALMAAG